MGPGSEIELAVKIGVYGGRPEKDECLGEIARVISVGILVAGIYQRVGVDIEVFER